ncbi:MAG: tRNA lysidine(34) synthetase TilS [Acidobacteria bacterium]|nr:tRNA lysidine(34) synthetase TilS [Acidobacteriota bacterium]
MNRFESDWLGQLRRRGDGVRDCRVLVACSGGGDSVALLAFLHGVRRSLGLDLAVAHADHGLRPEAGQDAALVESLCRSFDLDLVEARLEVRGRAAAEGQGLETAARDLRWAWLRAEAESLGAAWIATGHSLDDHTETVLLRLARGGGLGALTPLPAVQAPRWSPLIEARREDLRTYLQDRRIPWREDATNTLDITARNRVRKLLPAQRAEAPALDAHLWETHRQARELEQWRDEQVRAWNPGRWFLEAGALGLRGAWSELELRWVLEAALPRLGIAPSASLLRDLAAWAAGRMGRRHPRRAAWGAWALVPSQGTWRLVPCPGPAAAPGLQPMKG